MIGVMTNYRGHVATVIASSLGEAEEMLIELFDSVGVAVRGVQLELVVFDPVAPGGAILSADEPGSSMEGWGLDGWTPPR